MYSWSPGSSKINQGIIPQRILSIVPLDKDMMLLAGHTATGDVSMSGRLSYWDTNNNKEIASIDSLPKLRTMLKVGKDYWLGTQEGLYRLTEDRQVTQIQLAKFNKSFITSLIQHRDLIYISTYGQGIFAINPNNMDIESIHNKENFLSDDKVVSLIKDNQGNLWAGTYNGINVINSDNRIVLKVGALDGICHRELNGESVSKDAEGNLYFGTLNGVVKINPKVALEWTNSHGLHLKELRAYKGDLEEIKTLENNQIEVTNAVDSIVLDFEFPDYRKSRTDRLINYLELPKGFEANKKKSGLVITQKNLSSSKIEFANLRNNYKIPLHLNIKQDVEKLVWLGLLLFVILALLSLYLSRRRVSNCRHYSLR